VLIITTMKTKPALTLTLTIALVLALLGSNAGAQSAGSVDRSFNADTNIGAVFSIAVQPDGKVIVAGGWPSVGMPPITFDRLLGDGARDSDFSTGSGPNASVAKVLLLENGKMFIGGDFTAYDNILRAGLARVNSDGSLDATFLDAGLDGSVSNMALQSDGRLIITGGFSHINGIPRLRIARLHPDGSLDTAFNPGPQFLPANFNPPIFYAIAIQPNGGILLGGSFGDGSPQTPLNLARLNADGALDTNFRPPELLLPVFSLALLPDRRVLVGGEFWAPAVNLIRLFSNGTWDEAFEANIGHLASDPIVAALLVQADGRIIVGGQNISTAGGLDRHLLARLHPDGTGDDTFDPGTGPNFNWVHTLALQADGKLFVGGTFTAIDGVPAPGIARLHNTFETRVHFSQTVYETLESDRVATITVRRSGASTSRLRVLYAAHGGTARPGVDYHPAIGYLIFAPGETLKRFTVRLIDDRKPENTETILLRLKDRSGLLETSILTIIDNDEGRRGPGQTGINTRWR
jgi:uncharacterized delta-60 repeat protein